ncbi:MAG: lipase family protein [Rhodococcus sp. (in: high G+C Gram-positive bacteria)]|uniref:lipase family protein n=1 Tax=Rhodococcus sp. TaxID=1831 RepID=UPI003BB7BEDD
MGTRLRRRVLTAAVCAAAAVTAVVSSTQAAAAPVYPPLPADPFYRATAQSAGAAPGDVLGIRRMPTPPEIVGADTWQISFASTNSQGHPITAVTTVFAPVGKAPDGPLLSFQHVINALDPQCAPSQTLWTTDPNLAVREAVGLNAVLQQGWTVAIPDHLGPTSAYGAAKLGGQITLDGIRAVQRAAELQVGHSPVALAGYSGGGMATGWAAALAPSYAPELNIVGSAMGGVPMNLRKMVDGIGTEPHPVFGLAFAAALGLEREYPNRINLSGQLTPVGLAMRDGLTAACTNDILRIGAGGSLPQVTPIARLTDEPGALAVVDENSLELFPGVPNAPIFEWHSPTDALIPVDSIDATLDRYCAAGVPVQSLETPTPDHMSAAVLGLGQATDFLTKRFAGEDTPTTC